MTRYTPLWEQQGSYAAALDRRLISALWPAGATTGCAVTPATAMTVNVAAGAVAVPTQNNTGATLCSSDAVEQVTLTAAPGSGTNRVDLVICRPRANDLDGGANNDFIFDYVTGTPAATPVAPAAPAGTLALAQIYVAGGSAAIAAGNITDVRPGGLATETRASCRYNLASFTTSATPLTWQIVPFATKIFDDANAYNTGTGVWTCPNPGVYLFSFQLGFNPASGIQNNRAIYKNGAALVVNGIQASGYSEIPLTAVDRAAAGDTYDFRCQINTASFALRGAPESFASVGFLHP